MATGVSQAPVVSSSRSLLLVVVVVACQFLSSLSLAITRQRTPFCGVIITLAVANN